MRRSLLLLWIALSLAACDIDVVQVQIEDTFTPTLADVDVVFVVDNSNSMAEAQAAVAAALPTFTATLSGHGVDWRIAVTTTDMTDPEWRGRFAPIGAGGEVFVDGATAGGDALLAAGVQVGIEGSNLERGLQAAWFASTPPLATHDNDGFLRPDARLAVVVVSDEDDCSDEGALPEELPAACTTNVPALVTIDEYASRFRDYYAAPEDFGVWALVETGVTAEFEGCGGSTPGSRYVQMARASAGDVAPLCGDFAATMTTFADQVAGMRTSVQLSRIPSKRTMKVELVPAAGGGSTLSEDATRTDGWTWDQQTNTVRLWGPAVPALTDTIVVRYETG